MDAAPLDLASEKWSDLSHAYGSAIDVPEMLRTLQSPLTDAVQAELWENLWGALAHQGDVYDASFAAVPHIVSAIESKPHVTFDYFQFPSWVEICRTKSGLEVPSWLAVAYFRALKKLGGLAASTVTGECSQTMLSSCLSAIAVSHGQSAIAEAIMELSPEVSAEFLNWFTER